MAGATDRRRGIVIRARNDSNTIRWVAVQGMISVALLTWIFRGLDRQAFQALFARLPLWFYVVSLGVVLGGQVLYAWRWWLVLTVTGAEVSFSTAVRQYFVGIFVNNFLPSTVGGDLAKVYYIGRRTRLSCRRRLGHRRSRARRRHSRDAGGRGGLALDARVSPPARVATAWSRASPPASR